MKLTQVKGNTWVAEGMELIPFYQLDRHHCILLDSGLHVEQEELEQALLGAGLTPVGILNSHAHVDHCGNNRYFQAKYGAQVALTAPEAGMCCSLLNLKCYFLLLPPGLVESESSHMIHTPDVLIPAQDGPFSFAGAEFQILHTPGHSSGHVCILTPDRVCYAADALLSQEYFNSKLPYNLSHAMANASREKLRDLDCDAVVMAHRGVCLPDELDELIDENQALIRRRTQEILDLVDHPMTAGQIGLAVCRLHQLFTHKPPRALRFERNIRFFLEYLVDNGQLELCCRSGVTLYHRPVH
ncbi:MAG: MBL fold metallo-hydrolase [Lawsonibacter sp.]|jgi:hydroxyacylglutathione hydrolase